MNRIELTILKNLMHDEDYMRRVFPFLKEEYFNDSNDLTIYKHIKQFVDKYNSCPTSEALVIACQNDSSLKEQTYKDVVETIQSLQPEKSNLEWLLTETENFCKEKAVYNAIMTSISILDGGEKKLSKDGIPSLLQEALGVCFDNSVGHDYFDNSSDRYDFYHRVESRIPFDIDLFNKITKGGLPNKTLNIALAGCVHPDTKIRVRIKKY